MYFVGYEPGHPVKMFSKLADVESFISSCHKKTWWVEILKTKDISTYKWFQYQVKERETYKAGIYPNLGIYKKDNKFYKFS